MLLLQCSCGGKLSWSESDDSDGEAGVLDLCCEKCSKCYSDI